MTTSPTSACNRGGPPPADATGQLVLNTVGAGVVAFTLAVNLARGLPLVSLAAALLIAASLHHTWVRAGRPRGISDLAAQAEASDAET